MTLTKAFKEVGEFGDYEGGTGAKVLVHDGNVLFLSCADGVEMTVGVTIEHMLEVIAAFNRETGS